MIASGTGAAPLNFKQFDNLVGKYVKPESAETSKAVCICLEESEERGRVGVLKRLTVDTGANNVIEVRCFIQFFDRASGAFALQRRCSTFVPFVRDPPGR